jgi:hypothetical protein
LSYRLDTLLATLDKLEQQTGVSMTKEARKQRTADLDLGLAIARLEEDLPRRKAKLANLNETRELDEDHTRLCRGVNRSLNGGADHGLSDADVQKARDLLVGYIAVYKAKAKAAQ